MAHSLAKSKFLMYYPETTVCAPPFSWAASGKRIEFVSVAGEHDCHVGGVAFDAVDDGDALGQRIEQGSLLGRGWTEEQLSVWLDLEFFGNAAHNDGDPFRSGFRLGVGVARSGGGERGCASRRS